MRTAYLETLYELASKDKNVYAVISDNGAIVYDKYRQDLPEQFINAGISEANMVAMAAGMAERGKIPFAYTIGAFLAYRAYEFILNDVCMMNKNVKLVGIGEGCSYSLLGASHHTIFDFAALRPLPNLTILSPASPMEVKKCVKAAYEINGPVYIRLGTNREPEVYEGDYGFEVGKGVELKSGSDVTLISTGSIVYDVLYAAKELEKQGVSTRVVNIHTITPIDEEIIIKACRETNAILTVEEHSIIGGLGSAVAELISENNLNVRFGRIGLNDFVHGYGKHDELKAANGIGVRDIVDAVMRVGY
ncbi:transketolase family protein [Butyrivibrio sp. VCD2006]|uniref:transketolase family protein n=1 Tax=Butyrivibrio sp. VCD2006 TaxID=1280664 RepID=UPI0003F63357|nr:transketolase C-terminal domain-containing protein [Butyrivibrio sp. VCD2006]